MRKKTLIGLDLGSSAIKAVEFTMRKGVPVITGLAYADFKEDSLDARAQTLADTVTSLTTKTCCLGVSGRSVCVRYIDMNVASESDMHSNLGYEADRYIPFEVSEVYLDGQNITPFSETGEAIDMKVMLTAAKQDVVNQAHGVAVGAGLSPAIVDVEAFALGNALSLQRDVALAKGITENIFTAEVTALVDVGAFKTTVNVVKNGVSYFSREIYLGGNDFEQVVVDRMGVSLEEAKALLREPGENADSVDHLISTVIEEMAGEAKLAIDYFENQYEEQVNEVLVSGGGGLARPVIDQFQIQFERPVYRWDPFVGFDVDGIDLDDIGEMRSQFVVAIGLASRVMEL